MFQFYLKKWQNQTKMGIHYKQMLYTLQLTQSEFSIQDIHAILVNEFNYPSSGAWFRNLPERLDQRLHQAGQYARSYYKWLVLSQYNCKPK